MGAREVAPSGALHPQLMMMNDKHSIESEMINGFDFDFDFDFDV